MKVQMSSDKVNAADETIRVVGERIRQRRKRIGMTLNDLAERTGVSVSMLSMLERGLAGASIGTLVAVSSALGVQMRDLFDQPQVDQTDSPVIRLEQQTEVETAEGVHRRLAVQAEEQGLEVAVNEYAPGTSSNDRPIHHEGMEYGVVIEGSITVELDDKTYTLHAGDAIHYDSTIPHRIGNANSTVARAIWVNLRDR
jgi:transcriptional regulator with XRE-family HTH domain